MEDWSGVVRARLQDVLDPCSVARGRACSIVDLGLVEDVRFEAGTLHVTLVLTEPSCMFFFDIRQAVADTLTSIHGVEAVDVRVDGSIVWTPDRAEGSGTRRSTI
jgi:metal-sulfur cluster biosynthetic enzyme